MSLFLLDGGQTLVDVSHVLIAWPIVMQCEGARCARPSPDSRV